jgi:Tfp pilus assembly protein PilF/DNA-binding transcriptional MerR regulator
VGGYTIPEVARICRVSPARIRYWKRTRLFESARGGQPFGFRDLVSVRTVVDLIDRGVPLRRIRRSLAAVSSRIPELELPITALRHRPHAAARLAVHHDGVWVEPNGQTLFDFPLPASVPQGVAAPIAPAWRDFARRLAAEWFERGCQLDSERSTYAAAIAAYERALALDPGCADTHCNLGSVYFNQNRRSLARASYDRALALAPDHLEAHLNLATLFEEEGQDAAALRHYRRALALAPFLPDTHVSLALLYERLGLRRRSRGCWRRYLQLAPSGAWAEIARGRLGVGSPT